MMDIRDGINASRYQGPKGQMRVFVGLQDASLSIARTESPQMA